MTVRGDNNERLRVIVSPCTYRGWKALEIDGGPLKLVLVPQVGGRVMSMQWRGFDLSFTQPERRGLVEDLSSLCDVQAKKRELGLPLWGGEKTWLAPQTRWLDGLPFLDLDSGCYTEEACAAGAQTAIVRMTSPICRESGVQITRTIRVDAGASEWAIRHQIRNLSARVIEWAIWGVAMVLRPGRVYLPRNPSSAYPNGIKTFASEGQSTRLREKVVSEIGDLAVIACERPGKFKFGVDPAGPAHGAAQWSWILGVFRVTGLGLVGYRKRVPVYPRQTYGHGCIVEVFNSDLYPYCELETHGPVRRLSPGESCELEERHRLCDVETWPHTSEEVVQLASAVDHSTMRAVRSGPQHSRLREGSETSDTGNEGDEG